MAGADASNVDLVGRLKTLSPGRQKLMAKYFTLDEGDSWLLLSEYFGVALAFAALGTMIREANVMMREKEKESPDRVPAKLRRKALDAMLKSAMERLRGLARKTQTLEEKARERAHMEAAFQFERLEFLKRVTSLESTIAQKVEAGAAWVREREDLNIRVADADAQRGYFFKKMAEAEALLAELQQLRAEDGKANAKLVGIYAGREQAWKAEKTKMKHEIVLLKEKVSKLASQAQIKASHSCDTATAALKVRSLKRRAKDFVREKVVIEGEISALANVEQMQKAELVSSPLKQFLPNAEDHRGNSDVYESSTSHHQELEAELATILKKVGALKRRGIVGTKLDELLNEAAGKPKGMGSVDAASKTVVSKDNVEQRPESNSARDVRVGKEGADDCWQEVGNQGAKYMQRSYGLADEVVLKRDPVCRSINLVDSAYNDSTGFPHVLGVPNSAGAPETTPADEAHASREKNYDIEGPSVAKSASSSEGHAAQEAALNSNLTSEQEIYANPNETSGRDSVQVEGAEFTGYRNTLAMEYEGYTITCSEPGTFISPAGTPAHDGHKLGSVLSVPVVDNTVTSEIIELCLNGALESGLYLEEPEACVLNNSKEGEVEMEQVVQKVRL